VTEIRGLLICLLNVYSLSVDSISGNSSFFSFSGFLRIVKMRFVLVIFMRPIHFSRSIAIIDALYSEIFRRNARFK